MARNSRLPNPPQLAFSGGEVSPALYPRTDIEKYKTSLRIARNFILHAEGSISNRQGSKMINATKYSNKVSIAQEFVFSRTQVYELEIGEQYIRFYTNGARVDNSGAAYEVSTPYLESDLASLRFESSADVVWITHPNYKTYTLTRYGNADWVLDIYTDLIEDGPFMPENINEGSSLAASAVIGSSITLTLSAVIDTNIKALFHFDDSNGSTSTDESTGIAPVFFHGDAQISTAESVFGGSSLLLDGTGDYITLAPSASWLFNANLTISARIRMKSIASSFEIVSTGNGATNYWRLYWNSGDATLKFTYENIGSSTTIFASQSWSPVINTWYEVRVVRSGNNFHLFVNGVLLGTTVSSSAMAASGQPLSIGSWGGTSYANGYIDELIIYKGTATHTSGYTPATSPYTLFSASSNAFLFNPLHVGALFKLRHYVQGQTVSTAFTGVTTSTTINCFTTWRLITHGTWTGKFNVEKSIDAGTTWTILRTFTSANDFNANTSGTEDIETNQVPFLIRINMYAYTSGTANIDLTSDPYFQNGIVRATVYNSPVSMQANVLQALASTASTSSWAEGSWSDYRGYPRVARFFQDRLCFASTESEPQTIWMTLTGNYYSFRRNSPLLDTDAITINLPSRQLNAINGLVAFKKLIAFTSSSNWSIGPISTNALTPTSVQTDIEEYNGSADIAQVVIGQEAIYNDFNGEIVRNTGYQLQTDGFVGAEVNKLARHLFEGYTITKIVYQKSPNGIVWALRSDGVLLGMTYLKEQEVLGWMHHDTDGEILSMCVSPSSGNDVLTMVVQRDNGIYIEKMAGRRQFNISDHVFLDSYVEFENSTTTVSSLTHLANQIVGAIGDGTDLGTHTVSAGGVITLPTGYASLFVGLPFESDIETLDIDIPMAVGTMQGQTMKVGNVTFKLINSRGGYIGPDEDHLYNAMTFNALNNANKRENNVALGATENFTGAITLPLGGGASAAGRVFLRQTQPYPITVAAIIPAISPGETPS